MSWGHGQPFSLRHIDQAFTHGEYTDPHLVANEIYTKGRDMTITVNNLIRTGI